ncbi:retropepsin-like aspartic protease [Maribacter litoralis]|uniref:Aspartyl protease n=1 Tax=Maribacter litoralis TaxID=2059726 RepID=A0A653SNP9_9FLAO|nr:retropepsin-like aspartic protease [Maribacter litoralis]VXB70036.1 Aspartyl protease [Maribacter litoralis]
MSTLKKFLKHKDYVRIPLSLTATDHFEIYAEINDVQGRFILDTGASNTCIGMDKIEHFKLISEESIVKAAGAGATNMETLVSKENTINLNSWEYHQLEIVLFDLKHVNEALIAHNTEPVDGIIGADILKKSKAIIDYGKKCIYLKKKKR